MHTDCNVPLHKITFEHQYKDLSQIFLFVQCHDAECKTSPLEEPGGVNLFVREKEKARTR